MFPGPPALGQGHRWPVRESLSVRLRSGLGGGSQVCCTPSPPHLLGEPATLQGPAGGTAGRRANWSCSPARAALRGLGVSRQSRQPAVPPCCGLPALPTTGAWRARSDSWGRLPGRRRPRTPRRRRCPADQLTPDRFQAWLLWCGQRVSHGGREGLPARLQWPAPCQAVPRVLCPGVPSAACGRPEP